MARKMISSTMHEALTYSHTPRFPTFRSLPDNRATALVTDHESRVYRY